MERFIILFLLWVVVVAVLVAASVAMSAGWFLLGIPLIVVFGAIGWFALNITASA
jgi:hypothetical protein